MANAVRICRFFKLLYVSFFAHTRYCDGVTVKAAFERGGCAEEVLNALFNVYAAEEEDVFGALPGGFEANIPDLNAVWHHADAIVPPERTEVFPFTLCRGADNVGAADAS